jgi:hypothetical protein
VRAIDTLGARRRICFSEWHDQGYVGKGEEKDGKYIPNKGKSSY